MPTKEEAIEVIKTVEDPEIRIDIWTLGLIYNIDVKEPETTDIKMTFTSPMCPYGPMIVEELKGKLTSKGFKTVNVEVVFEPVWQPSEELRATLGI
ncbi:DUF59 domain-containing protein [Candidatus Woesearchaeota archaeon]|nr:DUF59 domain-containing protein [Candidatus Woesearchaeota archaeon]